MNFVDSIWRQPFFLVSAVLVVASPLSVYASAFIPQLNFYGGISHINMKKSTLTVSSNEVDTLNGTTNNTHSTGGIGAALDFLIPPASKSGTYLHDVSIGMDLFLLNTNSGGSVYQYGSPELHNYDYHLMFKTSRVMLDGTMGFVPFMCDVIPFVTAGVGVAHIQTEYYETPLSGVVGGQLNLPRRSQNNFAYSAGVGIKKMLSNHLQLSILYLYTDLGTARTASYSNSADNVITLGKPIETELQANTALMELSVLLA